MYSILFTMKSANGGISRVYVLILLTTLWFNGINIDFHLITETSRSFIKIYQDILKKSIKEPGGRGVPILILLSQS
jgi:hypothetical protein